MKDPYSVLEISPNASDDEVKKAYRDLARKYHPDNYHNTPLVDLASEKMKEINEAYDEITKMRSDGEYSDASYSANHATSSSSANSASYSNNKSDASKTFFSAVREIINRGNLNEAVQMLEIAPQRNAEWNFLMGSIYYKRGWMDDARSFFQQAVDMEPNNAEYRQALAIVSSARHPYRQTGYGTPTAGTDACDICTALMCTNLLCGGCRF